MKFYLSFLLAIFFCLSVIGIGQQPLRETIQATELTPQIAWFGVLDEGLAEAERTGKPILLVSAACQCAGVPGMW